MPYRGDHDMRGLVEHPLGEDPLVFRPPVLLPDVGQQFSLFDHLRENAAVRERPPAGSLHRRREPDADGFVGMRDHVTFDRPVVGGQDPDRRALTDGSRCEIRDCLQQFVGSEPAGGQHVAEVAQQPRAFLRRFDLFQFGASAGGDGVGDIDVGGDDVHQHARGINDRGGGALQVPQLPGRPVDHAVGQRMSPVFG